MLPGRCFVFFLSFFCLFSGVCGASTRRAKTSTTRKKVTTSAPTTTKKTTTAAPYTFCRYYNQIKKKLLDESVDDDFTPGKRSAVVELMDPRSRPFGSFNKIGFRLYFDGIQTVEYKAAVEACLYRKLQLVALDTPEEMNDPYFVSLTGPDVALHMTTPGENENFWTSAVPCSKSDPLDKATNSCSSVTWCSSGVETRLDYSLNLANAGARPFCMVYKRSVKQLVPTNCSSVSLFLCEMACFKPKCPSRDKCKKDESLFEIVDGKTFLKKDKNINGIWERSIYNISYFLGEKLVTWNENWKTCCSLGLKPIAITDNIDHLDRTNSPMQGVVYWSAMTRADCPYHFENCLHNVSEPISIPIIGVKDGGACMAMSVRDPSAKVVFPVGMGVKTTVCNLKLLLGCEGPEQAFQTRETSDSSQQPVCTGIPDCVKEDSYILKKPNTLLLAPLRFGPVFTTCHHVFIQLKHEPSSWNDAYKQCCSIGMDMIAMQSSYKQSCLESDGAGNRQKIWGKFWTSGRDLESCRGKLRWCSGVLGDFVKDGLEWKKGENAAKANNSCVYVDFGAETDLDTVPRLGLADCSEKKQILCEASSVPTYSSLKFLDYCKDSYMVKLSTINHMWNTSDFSTVPYRAKQLLQCMAEYWGLVYDGNKINERVYMKMMSRLFQPVDKNAIQNAMANNKEFLAPFYSKHGQKKISQTAFDMLNDVFDEMYGAHFKPAAELTSKLYECRDLAKNSSDIFFFTFLTCLLQSEVLDRFWQKYRLDLEPINLIPDIEDFFAPCLSFLTTAATTDLCVDPSMVIALSETGPFFSKEPIKVSKYKTSSYTACLERRGVLPYVDTKEEFDMLYSYFRRAAPNLTIIWDQGISHMSGAFKWCRSDLPNYPEPGSAITVPVPVNPTFRGYPLMLISLPGPEPNLHAVPLTEELKYNTDVFCRFSFSVMLQCSAPNVAYWPN